MQLFSLLADAEMQRLGISIGGLIAGGLCGLPALIGCCSRQRYILGVLIFLVCVACGAFAGIILALPVGLFAAVGVSNLGDRRGRY